MNKKFLSIILLLLVIAAGFFVFKTKKNTTGQNGTIVRNDVTGDSASLISQDGNNLKIKLGFKPTDNAKSVVRYYASLYQANSDGTRAGLSPISITKYDDKVVLEKGNGGVERTIVYNMPSYLNGKYVLMIDYINEIGMPLVPSMQVGSFDLKGTNNNFLELLSGTCKLQVAGESEGKKYDIVQGVDVKSDENLQAVCSVKSHFADETKVTPKVITYQAKDIYADNLAKQEDRKMDSITFAPNELKDITVSIPKGLYPQAYDAQLSFVDANGHQVSTEALLHYVVAGQAAGITAVTLDKNMYAAGEKANVDLKYYGSVDTFENSRLGGTPAGKVTLKVDLKNSKGDSCLAEMNSLDIAPDDHNGDRKVTLDIKNTCNNPYVTVIINREDGKTLFDQAFLKN